MASAEEHRVVRWPTGVEGFDKTMGGGLIPGKLLLIGGGYGSGKSSLAMSVVGGLSEKRDAHTVYASAEESVDGLLSIGKRLGVRSAKVKGLGNVMFVEDATERAGDLRAACLVVDSVNEISSRSSGGAAGSIAQMKAVLDSLKTYARRSKRCVIAINQLSAQGDLKGGTGAAHGADMVLPFSFALENDVDAPDAPEDSVDGLVRIFYCDKHREGPGPKTYWYVTKEGMLKCIPPRPRIQTPSLFSVE